MRNFDLVPQFIFRTPLLSWHVVRDFIAIRDKEEQEAFLKQIYSDDLVREAIYIASPSLFTSAESWLRGEIKEKDKKEKLVQSLTKYLLRMGTRCTPFGLFAGVSWGNWGGKSNIVIGEKENNLRFTGLDMEYIFNVKETILRQYQELLRYLVLYPNSALYQLSDKYKFIDYQYTGDRRKFSVSVVSHTDYLEQVLENAASGTTLPQLIDLLSGFDVSADEAEQYVLSLIEKQILVTELEPVLTEGYYFDVLLAKLEKIEREHPVSDDIRKLIETFRNVDANLKALREKGAVDFGRLYEDIKFKDLPLRFQAAKHFQTDMLKPAPDASLDFKIASAIRKGGEVLNRMSTITADENINAFKDKFRAKYDGKPVPLLEALDPETGIAYVGSNSIRDVNPLIDDITVTPPASTRKISNLEWSRKDSILLAKLLEARIDGDYTVEIKEKDIPDLQPDWDNLPDSINFVTSVVESAESESGLAIIMIGAGLSGAANIFSRFTHLDEKLQDMGNRIFEQERAVNPDAVLVDMVHLPDYSRIGNILQRSVSHRYELLFMAGGVKDRDQSIELNDLYLCVQNNRFVLFSQKLGKEVRVRLPTAHNYGADTHPVYHFLGDLQFQGLHWPLQFYWGPVERVYRFLPRVVYKADTVDIILNLASWLFDKKQYRHLLDAKGDAQLELLHKFRANWQIPKVVTLSEYDHDILVDFDNALCREVFYQWIAQRDSIKLKEFIKPAETLAVRDVNGLPYTNELVALFTRKEPVRRYPVFFPDLKDRIQRNFTLGSEWLYYKFYVGTKGADDLLAGPLKSIADELMAAGMIDKWFFIRYVDPEYHLRVRFHLTAAADLNAIIQLINKGMQKFVENSTVSKILTDTYQREIERYGERSMELTETLFFYDSIFFVNMLHVLKQSKDPAKARWLYILKSVDVLLNDFGLSLAEKSAFMKKIDVSERMSINKQTSVKYRKLEAEIDGVLSGSNQDLPWPVIGNLLAQRSQAVKSLSGPILGALKAGTVQIDTDNYLASIVHMTINRICISNPNEHEYVAYDLLYRYYASRLARQKKSAPAAVLNEAQ